MTVTIDNGRMIVTKNGETRLDTNEKFFHITNSFDGSITIPSVVNASPDFLLQTTNYDIGPVSQNATQVVGGVRFRLNSYGAGMAFDRWHSIWGGTIVWVMDGEPPLRSDAGSNAGFQQGVFYHFEIAAGRCRMVRTLYLAPLPTRITDYFVGSHTIDYKLKAGAWV